MELKELNERQRADHADKMYHILKGMYFYFSSMDRNTVRKCLQEPRSEAELIFVAFMNLLQFSFLGWKVV
jgi:hypothetical protein